MYFACMKDFKIKPAMKLEMFLLCPLNQITVNCKRNDNVLYILPSSDAAARKVRNLLTNRTCFIY